MEQKRYKIILATLGLAYLAFHLFLLNKYPCAWEDEGWFVDPALSFLNKGNFSTTFGAQEAGYADSNYFTGRLYTLAVALFIRLFGFGLFQSRLTVLLSGIGVLILCYRLSKRLFGKTTALWSVIFLALSHTFVFHSHLARPEMMSALFLLITINLFLEAVDRKSRPLYFASGLVAFLSFDVHPHQNMSIMILGALALWHRQQLNKGDVAAGFSGAASGVFWWLAWHVLPDPSGIWFQYKNSMTHLDEIPPLASLLLFSKEIHRWYSFFWEGFGHRNMILLAVLLAGIARGLAGWKQKSNLQLLLWLILALVTGYTLLSPNPSVFYLAVGWPLLVILMGHTLIDMTSSTQRYTRVFAYLMALAVIGVFCLENGYKLARFGSSNYRRTIANIAQHIPAGARVFGQPAYWFGLWGPYHYQVDHPNVWFYTGASKNVPAFVEKEKIEYIVADEEFVWYLPNRTAALEDYFNKHCQLVATIEDRHYGSTYLGMIPWNARFTIRIFKVHS